MQARECALTAELLDERRGEREPQTDLTETEETRGEEDRECINAREGTGRIAHWGLPWIGLLTRDSHRTCQSGPLMMNAA
jgi:hypothetical protein